MENSKKKPSQDNSDLIRNYLGVKTKKELQDFLSKESRNYITMNSGLKTKLVYLLASNPGSTQHHIWNYVKKLRFCEYNYYNSIIVKPLSLKTLYNSLLYVVRIYSLRKLSYKLGIQIPPGCFGKGLQIYHYGSIIVNQSAKIGENATIYPGVVIGEKGGGCPTIGDNCFIGAGSKILGGVLIGNNVIIAPNAVVVHDVPDNVIVAGVPAKIIKKRI